MPEPPETMHWPEMADVEDAMNARAPQPQPQPAPYDDAVMPEWLARPTRYPARTKHRHKRKGPPEGGPLCFHASRISPS